VIDGERSLLQGSGDVAGGQASAWVAVRDQMQA